MIELRRHLVVDRGPGIAAVERDAGASVVALYHPPRVCRVDPQVVVVAVRGTDFGERLAAVDRLPGVVVQNPDGLSILRVSEYVLVVPGAALQVALIADQLPCIPVIFRPVDAAVIGLDRRPDTAGLCR